MEFTLIHDFLFFLIKRIINSVNSIICNFKILRWVNTVRQLDENDVDLFTYKYGEILQEAKVFSP